MRTRKSVFLTTLFFFSFADEALFSFFALHILTTQTKHTHENARASESSIETRVEERIRIPVYSSTFFVMWFYRRSSSSSIFVLVLVLLLVLFY